MTLPASVDDLNPELRGRLLELESITMDAEALVRDLSEDQLSWRPQLDKWSIAQCLDHLTTTARADLPHIHDAIRNARAKGLYGAGPFRYGFLGRWLTQLMDGPPRIRFRAPRVYAPQSGRAAGEVVRDFPLVQQELMTCIREANGLDLARAKVTVPIQKFIKLSLGQEFALIAAHERRHLWQAWQIRARPDFPSKMWS